MIFKNRYEAAVLLSKRLEKYRGRTGIVMAVPRGGVPVGYEVAKHLGFPLDIVLSKKIGHPRNPEFAIGSVSMHGVMLDDSARGIPEDYIQYEVERIKKLLRQKYATFMKGREPADLKGKTVIVVDDGIATGNTMMAIIDTIRRNKPEEIIIAVPVASPSAVELLSPEVNEVVCVDMPEYFRGVGQFYADFTQTSDEEVMEFLEKSRGGAQV